MPTTALTHERVGDVGDVGDVGYVVVVEILVRRLDATSGEALSAEVSPLIGEETQVVLDLGQVTFIDSAGLSAILSCLKQAVAMGGDLKLCAVSPAVRDTLELARLPRILEVHASRAEAVGSYA